MKAELLISTCNDRISGLLDLVKKTAQENSIGVLIVHQVFDDKINQDYQPIYSKIKGLSENVRIIKMNRKGLSASRNEALKNSIGKYLLICDDDVDISISGILSVCNEFDAKPDADIIFTQVLTPEGEYFKKYKDVNNENLYTLAGISSIEICLKRESFIRSKLQYDERFGLGAEYPSCEEFILLTDAYKSGLSMKRTRINVMTHPKESSGKQLTNDAILRAKGAAFCRVYGMKKGYLITIIFFIKKIIDGGFTGRSKIYFLRKILSGARDIRHDF
ncbi:glycosyltransferase family A protein [Serratia fonticola]|uniref:glycosyltransferase family A protein n=1 Tax=Serratia fonticola TaxID=47917 RepID=UPI001645F00E|nr:glycosyltransferase family A protein [Serratia fonticola]MBC3216073.1 glycosyltransferase family 2 protein [Serratia fonticola]